MYFQLTGQLEQKYVSIPLKQKEVNLGIDWIYVSFWLIEDRIEFD